MQKFSLACAVHLASQLTSGSDSPPNGTCINRTLAVTVFWVGLIQHAILLQTCPFLIQANKSQGLRGERILRLLCKEGLEGVFIYCCDREGGQGREHCSINILFIRKPKYRNQTEEESTPHRERLILLSRTWSQFRISEVHSNVLGLVHCTSQLAHHQKNIHLVGKPTFQK